MKKRIKIILLVLAAVIFLPPVFLLVEADFRIKPVHGRFVSYFNEKFGEDVSFDDFSFSYLLHFPNINLKIEGVRVTDHQKEEVIRIEEVDIVIAPASLWRNEVNIRKVKIRGAMFRSEIDSLGNKPKILAKKKDTLSVGDSKGIKFKIDSQDIEIRDSKLYFGNQVKGNRTYVQVYRAALNLKFRDSLITVTGSMEGHLDSLISNNTVLFADQPVKGEEIEFHADLATGEKVLEKGYLMAHTLKLYPRLNMRPRDDGQQIELHISGDSTFDDFLELFQFHLGIELEQTNPDAELRIAYNQKGFVNPFLRPYSELDFEIIDADFTGPGLPYPIENVLIAGNYNNGEDHSPVTVQLELDTLHAEIQESFVDARIKLTNMDDPLVDARFVSSLDISNLVRATENMSVSGIINADLQIDGRISELKAMHLEGKQQAKGLIEVKDLELIINDQKLKLELMTGSSLLNNHFLEVTTLVGAYNESAFHFQGLFENLDQFFLSDNKDLIGSFKLEFDRFDLNDLHLQPQEKGGDKNEGLFSFESMAVDLTVIGHELITPVGPIKNIRMKSRVSNNSITLNSFGFDYQEGHVSGYGAAEMGVGGIESATADIKGTFRNLIIEMPEPEQSPGGKHAKAFTFPGFLKGRVELDIDRGSFNDIPLRNMHLKAGLDGRRIALEKFAVDIFDGHASVNGEVELDTAGVKKLDLTAGLSLYQIDLDGLIQAFGGGTRDGRASRETRFPESVSVSLDMKVKEVDYKDMTLRNFSAKLKADDNKIQLDRLYADLPFGSIDLAMDVNNYKNKDPLLAGAVKLMIDSLGVDRFLEMEALGLAGHDVARDDRDVTSKKEKNPTLPGNIDLALDVKANHLSYKNIKVDDLDMNLVYSPATIELNRLDFHFARGVVQVNGYVVKDNPVSIPGYLYSKVDSIDIREIFHAFDNFDQDKFTGDNSSGKLSWSSHYYFDFSKEFALQREGNLLILNTVIHDAEFDQVEPIEKTLFFVGHKTREKMVVSKLNVNSFMYGDKMYFMDVLMNDNIANLDVFGEVDLDDRSMNLDMAISLSDLFFRSKSKRMVQTEQGEVNMEKDSKVFLNLSGPLDDHKLKLSNNRRFDRARDNLLDNIKKAEKDFRVRQKELRR